MIDQILALLDLGTILAAIAGAIVTAAAFGVKKVYGKVDEYVAGTPNVWDDEAWDKFKEAIRAAVKED